MHLQLHMTVGIQISFRKQRDLQKIMFASFVGQLVVLLANLVRNTPKLTQRKESKTHDSVWRKDDCGLPYNKRERSHNVLFGIKRSELNLDFVSISNRIIMKSTHPIFVTLKWWFKNCALWRHDNLSESIDTTPNIFIRTLKHVFSGQHSPTL